MQSKLLRVIFTINSALLRLLSLVLITFGSYIIWKTESVERLNELAAFSITFGTLIFLTFVVNGIAQSRQKSRLFIVTICLHAACLSSCASVIFMYSAYQQQFNAFFSRQIDILWTIKDSSLVHKKVIFLLQELIDCCKIHNLVDFFFQININSFRWTFEFQIDYNINLPRPCCVNGDFDCRVTEPRCRNLQPIIYSMFITLIIMFSLRLLQFKLLNSNNKRKLIQDA